MRVVVRCEAQLMRRAMLAVFRSVMPVNMELGILVAATSCCRRYGP